ncbi:unnamed protein product [Lymnaea stagnalis]|uniref:G-protein coupled receptors family 1 profile domain-containing protein n=1 Tax=Lymnaea stagnalis TaxID=6523 RepID=A0AAV2HVQ1_LYMST
MLDFIFVNYVILSALISTPGVVFNIINIVVFIRLGVSDTINISLLGLALADIGVLLTLTGYSVMYNPLVLASVPQMDVIDAVNYVVLGTPHVLFSRIAGCLTAFIAVERCLCIAWPLRVKSLLTPWRTGTVVICIYIVLVSSTLSLFVANRIGPRFNQEFNLTAVGLIVASNVDLMENISLTICIIAQMTAFAVVTMSTLGLVRSLIRVAKWRKSTSVCARLNHVSIRDKQLVKMIVILSTVFIVCALPTVVGNLVMIFLKDFNVKGTGKSLFICCFSVFFVLEAINSSANIFIYFKMSSKFKEMFLSMFGRKNKPVKR